MNLPNLASRPFLNTRPVWLVTGVSAALTLVFVVLNLLFYVSSNRTLATRLDEYQELEARAVTLRSEVQSQVGTLDKVPWRSLADRVNATNLVLKERSFSWLALLDDIERVMPYDVRLTRVSPSLAMDGVTLNLTVACRSREAMLELLDNLIKDPSFSGPLPIKEQLPEESPAAGYDLSLKVNYHPPEVAP